jgi:hypothetical protein
MQRNQSVWKPELWDETPISRFTRACYILHVSKSSILLCFLLQPFTQNHWILTEFLRWGGGGCQCSVIRSLTVERCELRSWDSAFHHVARSTTLRPLLSSRKSMINFSEQLTPCFFSVTVMLVWCWPCPSSSVSSPAFHRGVSGSIPVGYVRDRMAFPPSISVSPVNSHSTDCFILIYHTYLSSRGW